MTRRAQRIVAAVLDEKADADVDPAAWGRRRGEAALVGHLPFDRQPADPAPLRQRWARCELQRARPRRCGRPDGRGAPRAAACPRRRSAFPRKDTCLAIYSHRVNTQRPLAETLASVFPWCAEWEEELTGLYRAYVERKLANQALDYDDLLLYWHAMAAGRGARARDRRAVRPDPGGRVPGHQRAAGGNPAGAAAFRARASRWSGTMRSRSTRFARPRWRTSSAFPARYAPAAERGDAGRELSLDAGRARCGERADRRGAAPVSQDAAGQARRGERPRYVTVVDDQAQAEYVVAQRARSARARRARSSARRCCFAARIIATCSSSNSCAATSPT